MTWPLSQWILVIGGSAALSLIVKATLTLAAGLVAARVARRARAATRHQILASTFVCLLMLPALAVLMPVVAPAFHIGVPIRNTVSNPIAAAAGIDAVRGAGVGANGTANAPASVAAAQVAAAPQAGSAQAGSVAHAGSAAHTQSIAIASTWPAILPNVGSASLAALAALAAIVWIAGTSLLLLWLAVALWRFDRLRRRALPWMESRALVTPLANAAGISRAIDVVLHEDLVVPVTCGWRSPTILLPADAPKWNASHLRRALVHELEHVRRGDWAFHLVAFAACAAFWFQPLAWIALRRLRLEAERACDDAVLELADAEQADYAEQLVQLARRLSSAAARPALAMAGRSDLSTRVMAILDRTQARGRLGRMPAAVALIASLALALAVAPLRAVGVDVDDAIGGVPGGVPGGVSGRVPGGISSGVSGGVTRGVRRSTSSSVQDSMSGGAQGGTSSGVEAGVSGGARGGVAGGIDAQEAPSGRTRRPSARDRALYEAAEDGDLPEIDALLAGGADVNASISGDGSPLIGAARSGKLDAVKLLLDQGADPNLGVGGDGNPIIMAAREGHVEIVELLLNRGAHIDQVVPGDENALIQASAAGQLAIVKLLVSRGADVNAQVRVDEVTGRRAKDGEPTGEWRTPLNMARKGGHAAVVDYLLSAGARD